MNSKRLRVQPHAAMQDVAAVLGRKGCRAPRLPWGRRRRRPERRSGGAPGSDAATPKARPLRIEPRRGWPGEQQRTRPRSARNNFDAAAFQPPSGDGALVGLWDSLPPLTGDSFCPVLSQIVGGPGGIWLSGNATRW